MKQTLLVFYTLLFSCFAPVLAQVVVTFPGERAVFQRNNSNEAVVHIAGYLTQPFQQVEARFVPKVSGEGQSAPADGSWLLIDNSIEASHFYGSMTVKGGWYELQVRGVRDGVPSQSISVQRVGVGEVFVVAGQSNATGGDSNPNGPGAKHDQVNSVNFQNVNNGTITPYSSLELPCPEFVHLDAATKTAPFGNYAWCWGAFGDKIYEKFRVPVMIFNGGWSSTAVDNWKESINPNVSPVSAFGYTFPAGLPFGHLRIALNYYIAQLGIRAVLWHQGETDNYIEQAGDNTQSRYIASLWNVISASRNLSGKSNLAWVVARASRFTVNGTSRVSAAVVGAQNTLINSDATYPHIYQGPDTDPYFDITYRSDQIHFRGDGVSQYLPNNQVYSGLLHLAGFWADKITSQFLSQSVPYAATPPPAVSAVYTSGGSQTTFTGPAIPGSSQYAWFGTNCNQTEFQGQQWTVGPGLYKLKIIDANRNTVFSPQLNVSANPLPVTWKSFSAKLGSNGRVMLEWATSSERNNALFEVERSIDAVNFNLVKSVSGALNANTESRYAYEDEYLKPGTYYYRIRQTDIDGAFDFTRILPVKIDGSLTVRVYPNPVTDKITVESAFPIGRIEVTDLSGRVVYTAETALSKSEIDFSGLSKGLYLINAGGTVLRVLK